MEPIVQEELDKLHEELDVLRRQVTDLVKMFAGTEAASKVASHKKIKDEDEVIMPSDKRVAKG